MKTAIFGCAASSLLVTLTIVHSSSAKADPQEAGSEAGVIENRWKLDDVRREYEEHAQLKRKEHREAWRKQLIDGTGIAWDLSDAIGMIRGDVDPTSSEAPECVLDAVQDSDECFRLTVVPVRSDLTDVKVSMGEFRSVAGGTRIRDLPIQPLVQKVEGGADGGWNLVTPATGDAISRKNPQEYVIFVKIPKSTTSDEYFGRLILDAKEKASNKPVQLVLPLSLQVRGFTLPRKVTHVDKHRLSCTTLSRDEYDEFRQLCTLLTEELNSTLSHWAKTDDDKLFVRECQALLQDCGSVELADVGKRSDFASMKSELAARLDRARLVAMCNLHNVSIATNNNSTPGRSILSPQLYVPGRGKIVVAYHDLVYKSDAVMEDDKVAYVASCDDGLTWEPYPQNNVPHLSQAAILPPDGKTRIEAFSYGWENHPESDRPQLEAKGFHIFDTKEGNIPGVLSVCYRAGMKRSRDGGATWEIGEIKLPRFMPDLRPMMMGIALQDGTFLYPMYGRYDIKKEKYVSSFVLRTTDGGDTWEIHTIANAMNGYFDKSARGEAANGFNETSLVEAPNGNVVAVIRTTDQIELWTATSKDGGKTWSEPRDSCMRGSAPFCVKTRDGYLVCIHGRREERLFPDGTGMYAGISKDNGQTWHSICIEDDGLQFVDSYAQAVALPEGKVFTIYTAPRGGLHASCGTLFTPSRLEHSVALQR